MGYALHFDAETSRPIAVPGQQSPAANKLLGLELLRFAAALAVLLCHYEHFAKISAMPAIAQSSSCSGVGAPVTPHPP